MSDPVRLPVSRLTTRRFALGLGFCLLCAWGGSGGLALGASTDDGYNRFYQSLVQEREGGRGAQISTRLESITQATLEPAASLRRQSENDAAEREWGRRRPAALRSEAWREFESVETKKRSERGQVITGTDPSGTSTEASDRGDSDAFAAAARKIKPTSTGNSGSSSGYYGKRGSSRSEGGDADSPVDTIGFLPEVNFGAPRRAPAQVPARVASPAQSPSGR